MRSGPVFPAGHLPEDQCAHERALVAELRDFALVRVMHCPDCAKTWTEPNPERAKDDSQ